MAEINPLRYRGYYYDTDTGFYYLQSRYYDPVTHRFINADSLASTGQGILGYNMFGYCNNSPVLYSDEVGHAARLSVSVINDGGSKLSSYNLQLLSEINALNNPYTFDDDKYYNIESAIRYNITKRSLKVDVSNSTRAFLDSSINFFFYIAPATVASITTPQPVGTAIGIIAAVTPVTVQNIAYCGTPVIPNGFYTVYEVDKVVSSNTVIINGSPYLHEAHCVATWYILNSPTEEISSYCIIDEKNYFSEIYLGG